MSKKLVIVESPTKAKTIRKFLPRNYEVQACMGHVRDLPASAKEIPDQHKKSSWGRLGVDVENDFEPLYVVSPKKTKTISDLRKLLKESDELFLATDEDREGESISWHLLETLKPKVPVHRMVFHEITKTAIQKALDNPRNLDMNLVRAQETRRILDRLVGYTVSPMLWKKVAWGLSAGRVQSVAVKIIVQRELARRRFKKATYWDIDADLRPDAKAQFNARLVEVGGKKLATGKDFDENTGMLAQGKTVLVLGEAEAKAVLSKLKGVPWLVKSVEEKPLHRKPAPPLITSTLQQESNRKLGLSSKETMSIAQRLYEQGLITYMRTDSTNLSDEAIGAARRCVVSKFGNEYVAPAPRKYATTAKGAQEAHEAIRPSLDFTTPKETGLRGKELEVYELIWMRTVATQMKESEQVSMTVAVSASDCLFTASGTRIVFPGFLRAYVEGSDDVEAALEDKENPLPAMSVGDKLTCESLQTKARETKPPARFTEASLIQTMEKEGIGRPSTYAATVSTIIDRGYVRKAGSALVPTFMGMVVNQVLEKSLPDLVDVKFTANMEEYLDDIAVGKMEWLPYLKKFFLDKDGLQARIKIQEKEIDPEDAKKLRLEGMGDSVEIRVGKFGPYFVKRGPGGATVQSNIPENVAPADLTQEQAEEILQQAAKGPESLGEDPTTGMPVFLRTGTYGPYIQLGISEEGGQKPKRVSLPPGIEAGQVDLPIALRILQLPRTLGAHPQTGKNIVTNLGRFGPYVMHDGEFRSLKKEDSVLDITFDRAMQLLSEPKGVGRSRGTVLKDLGKDPISGEAVIVMDGKFGPYVKAGKVNATIPKEISVETLTLTQANELVAAKAGQPSKTKKRIVRKKS